MSADSRRRSSSAAPDSTLFDTGTPSTPLDGVRLRDVIHHVESIRNEASPSQRDKMLPHYVSQSTINSSSSMDISSFDQDHNYSLQRELMARAFQPTKARKMTFGRYNFNTDFTAAKRPPVPPPPVAFFNSPIVDVSPRTTRRHPPPQFAAWETPVAVGGGTQLRERPDLSVIPSPNSNSKPRPEPELRPWLEPKSGGVSRKHPLSPVSAEWTSPNSQSGVKFLRRDSNHRASGSSSTSSPSSRRPQLDQSGGAFGSPSSHLRKQALLSAMRHSETLSDQHTPRLDDSHIDRGTRSSTLSSGSGSGSVKSVTPNSRVKIPQLAEATSQEPSSDPRRSSTRQSTASSAGNRTMGRPSVGQSELEVEVDIGDLDVSGNAAVQDEIVHVISTPSSSRRSVLPGQISADRASPHSQISSDPRPSLHNTNRSSTGRYSTATLPIPENDHYHLLPPPPPPADNDNEVADNDEDDTSRRSNNVPSRRQSAALHTPRLLQDTGRSGGPGSGSGSGGSGSGGGGRRPPAGARQSQLLLDSRGRTSDLNRNAQQPTPVSSNTRQFETGRPQGGRQSLAVPQPSPPPHASRRRFTDGTAPSFRQIPLNHRSLIDASQTADVSSLSQNVQSENEDSVSVLSRLSSGLRQGRDLAARVFQTPTSGGSPNRSGGWVNEGSADVPAGESYHPSAFRQQSGRFNGTPQGGSSPRHQSRTSLDGNTPVPGSGVRRSGRNGVGGTTPTTSSGVARPRSRGSARLPTEARSSLAYGSARPSNNSTDESFSPQDVVSPVRNEASSSGRGSVRPSGSASRSVQKPPSVANLSVGKSATRGSYTRTPIHAPSSSDSPRFNLGQRESVSSRHTSQNSSRNALMAVNEDDQYLDTDQPDQRYEAEYSVRRSVVKTPRPASVGVAAVATPRSRMGSSTRTTTPQVNSTAGKRRISGVVQTPNGATRTPYDHDFRNGNEENSHLQEDEEMVDENVEEEVDVTVADMTIISNDGSDGGDRDESDWVSLPPDDSQGSLGSRKTASHTPHLPHSDTPISEDSGEEEEDVTADTSMVDVRDNGSNSVRDAVSPVRNEASTSSGRGSVRPSGSVSRFVQKPSSVMRNGTRTSSTRTPIHAPPSSDSPRSNRTQRKSVSSRRTSQNDGRSPSIIVNGDDHSLDTDQSDQRHEAEYSVRRSVVKTPRPTSVGVAAVATPRSRTGSSTARTPQVDSTVGKSRTSGVVQTRGGVTASISRAASVVSPHAARMMAQYGTPTSKTRARSVSSAASSSHSARMVAQYAPKLPVLQNDDDDSDNNGSDNSDNDGNEEKSQLQEDEEMVDENGEEEEEVGDETVATLAERTMVSNDGSDGGDRDVSVRVSVPADGSRRSLGSRKTTASNTPHLPEADTSHLPDPDTPISEDEVGEDEVTADTSMMDMSRVSQSGLSPFSVDSQLEPSVLDRLPPQPAWYANVSLLVALVKMNMGPPKKCPSTDADDVEQFKRFQDACISAGLRLTSPTSEEQKENEKLLKKVETSSPAGFYYLCTQYLPKKELSDACPFVYFALLRRLFSFHQIIRRLVPVSAVGSSTSKTTL